MVGELTTRVTVETTVLVALLAGLAGALAGAGAAGGVLAGGALAIVNFRWLARGALRLTTTAAGGRPGAAWLLAAGLRFAGLFAALAVILGSGLVHPLGLVAGLTVLPGSVIVQGLRAAVAPEPGEGG